jgi:hypothetical protein
METHNPGHAAAAAQSYYEQQAKSKRCGNNRNGNATTDHGGLRKRSLKS